MNSNEEIVRRLWRIFDARKFSDVRPLLHEDFACVWPQSKEIIRGADNFIAMNENYPGEWSINVVRTMNSGNTVISEIELNYKDQVVYAVSFFEIADGKISKATEYWGESYEAPEWRSRWVEKLS